MKVESFGGLNRKPGRPQATRVERPKEKEDGPDMTRRRLMQAVGALAALTAGGAAATLARKALEGAGPEKEVRPAAPEPEPSPKQREIPSEPVGPIDRSESSEMLEKYTFLSVEAHPEMIPAWPLVGKRFADLYAAYLGIPDKSMVPEELKVDFKANLALLWRMKFGFDKPGRSSEEEQKVREEFLREHKDLMDLAEELYRSYDPKAARRETLEEYVYNVSDVVHDAHEQVLGALYGLRNDPLFPKPRRELLERMASQISADKLVACSLTELMPSADGETNAQVFDFLLRFAGEDLIDRVPSMHDMLASFGPYQITPLLFKPGGGGTLAEKIKEELPPGYLPQSVEEVRGDMHHRMAYVIAVGHAARFATMLSPHETQHVIEWLNHADPKARHKEVLTFIAMAHHNPHEACVYFKDALMRWEPQHTLAETAGRVEDVALRQYKHKAIANYEYLANSDALKDA